MKKITNLKEAQVQIMNKETRQIYRITRMLKYQILTTLYLNQSNKMNKHLIKGRYLGLYHLINKTLWVFYNNIKEEIQCYFNQETKMISLCIICRILSINLVNKFLIKTKQVKFKLIKM